MGGADREGRQTFLLDLPSFLAAALFSSPETILTIL